jgi:benzoate-CoA ligase family protein
VTTDAGSEVRFSEDLNLTDYFLLDRLKDGLGGKVAIRFGDRAWTYAEVADRSLALARWMVANGLRPEERVYIVLPDLPPFAWSIFGTLAAGGVVTMGNPAAPIDDIAYVIDYVRASVVITTPEVSAALAERLPPTPRPRAMLLVPDTPTGEDPERRVTLPEPAPRYAGTTGSLARAIMEGRDLETPLPRVRRDDPAVWLFTSGSTGRAKAAMHTHRDFAFNTEVYAKRTVGYRMRDVAVSVPRLFFGYATGTNLWFPFAVGATVGLFSERPTADSLYAAIEKYQPTIVTNVPTMLGKLLDLDDERRAQGAAGLDLSCVRFHLSAGEALPPALLTRFLERFGGGQCEVYDGIGSAEMFHIYCSNRPGDVVPGSLGRAVEGYTLRVLPEDADGPGAAPVAAGEIGVLWVRGDSVALGYHQDRDKSWKTFHGHWCRTGDLFRIDERGYLWFSGRADDLFKVGGLFVAPIEVEDCLLAHAAVSGAAVIPAVEDGLTKPKAIVVVRPEARAQLATAESRRVLVEALQDHVRTKLSKHKYPRWIVFVDELPKNDRGKVDKKALTAREAAGDLIPS